MLLRDILFVYMCRAMQTIISTLTALASVHGRKSYDTVRDVQ